MLLNDVSVPWLKDVEPITLEFNKPTIIFMEGTLGIGKTLATAYWCIGKPLQPGLFCTTLGEQTPYSEPLYVNLKVGGEKYRFWPVEEKTKPLEGYYEAIDRFTKGIDKEPSPLIAEFQIDIMKRRRAQAVSILPRMIEKGICPFVERSPWGDSDVFAKNLINMEAIRGDLRKEYENLSHDVLLAWDGLRSVLGVDMVAVYMLAEDSEAGKHPVQATQKTADIAFRRKDERNRLAEKSVTPAYMYRLNQLYNELFGRNPGFDSGPVLPVNTGLDLEVDPIKEVALLDDIAKGLCYNTDLGVKLL